MDVPSPPTVTWKKINRNEPHLGMVTYINKVNQVLNVADSQFSENLGKELG